MYTLFISMLSQRQQCARGFHADSNPDTITLDALESEKHPISDVDFIFQVHVKKCGCCGKVYTSNHAGLRGGIGKFLRRNQ